MALSERLILDTQQAFAALDQLNTQLNRIDDETLTPTLDIQSSGLDNIDQTLREAEQAADNLATAAGRASAELRLADTNVEALASSLGVSEDRARQMAGEFVTSRNRADDTQRAAADVARQLGLAEDDARQFARQMARAEDETDDTATAAGRLSGGFRTIRNLLVGGLAAFGITQAVQGLVGEFGRAVDASINLSESANAVNVVFEEGAQTIRDFASAAAGAAGLSTAAAQQLVVPIGSLLRNFGFDAQEAADATVILTQRAADLASVFNTDVTESLTAIQAALRGEADPLERFGASISAARVETFALAEGLAASKGEITDSIKLQARLGLILQDTDRVAGDFANTSDQLANRQRILNAELENFRAGLGEALLPAMETLVDVAPVFLASLEDLVPVVQDLAEQFAELAPDLVAFAEGIPDAITETVNFGKFLRDLGQAAGEATDSTNRAFDGLLRWTLEGGVLEGLLGEPTKDVQSFADAFDDVQIDVALGKIQRGLQQGLGPAEAFATALVDIGDSVALTEDDLDNLVRAADLDELDVSTIENLIATFDDLFSIAPGAEANFDLITAALQRLRLEALLPTDVLARGFAIDTAAMEAAAAINDVSDAAADAVPTLADVADLAETAGVTFTELALGTAELDPEFRRIIDSGEGIAAILREVASDADAAATVLSTTLAGAITSASDAFVDANEDNRVSAAEFLAGLTESAADTAAFETNLLELAALFPALAETLRTAGAEVAGDAAADFAANFDLAGQAEEVLRGDIPGAADAIAGFAGDAVDLADTDPAALAFWEAFAASLETPGFADGVQSAVDAVLGALSASVPFTVTPSGDLQPGGGGTGILGPGGSSAVNVTINNPVTEDVTSSAAQAGQIVGSVAGLLGAS